MTGAPLLSEPLAQTRPERYRALDGLRAMAVVLVFLFHTGIRQFRDGFIGVDIFFVLSGFLITTLALREQEATGRIDYWRFFHRRFFRLYPALVVLCVGSVAFEVVAGHHLGAVTAGAGAALLYVANLWIYTSGHDTYLLQHTWTLALEQQFYLSWPLILILALRQRRGGRTLLMMGMCLVWLAVVIVPIHSPDLHSVRDSYVRAAGLPLGCVLALLWPLVSRYQSAITLAGSLALAFLLFAGISDGWLPGSLFDNGAGSVAAVATVPAVAVLLAPPSWLRDLFANRAVVWLGSRSYAVYLWHFPLLAILLAHAMAVPVWGRAVIAWVLTLAAAELSFRCVEAPALAFHRRHLAA